MKKLAALSLLALTGCFATVSDMRRIESKIDDNHRVTSNNMNVLREELKIVILTEVRKTCIISTPSHRYEIPSVTALECHIIGSTLQRIMQDEAERLKSNAASDRI